MMTKNKLNVKAKRRARRFALQALYQWQMNPEPAYSLLTPFLAMKEMESVDTELFKELVEGVLNHCDSLDAQIQPHLDRAYQNVYEIEKAILRMGSYELNYHLETPYRVILNEAIELAKTFACNEAHKYINGILHTLVTKMRPQEHQAI